ncbi:prolyl oligopeptidase family serine peptidase [bacterium]|nr:prolyl oligopeptidase family serine peptidase [bacterium]
MVGSEPRGHCEPDHWRPAMPRGIRVALAALIVHAAVPVGALVPDDLLSMRTCGIGSLTPDGQRLVYTVGEYDPDDRRMRQTAHLVDLDTGEQRVLTTPDDRARGFAFCPAGTSLAFLRDTDAGTEIWLMAADGSRRRRVAGPGRFGALHWSPDGRRLAHVVSDVSPDYAGIQGRVTVADHLGWRHLNLGEREGSLRQLRLVDLRTGDDVALPMPDLDVREVAWSPDGQHLVVSAKHVQDLGRTLDTELLVVDQDGRHVRRLTRNPGPDHHAVWYAPDRIAYQTHPDSLHESEPSELAVIDARTGAEVARHLAGFDDAVWGIWEHAGRFYARGAHRGTAAVFAVTDGGVRQLTPRGWNCWDIRFGGDRAVFWAHSFGSPGVLFELDLDSGQVSELLDPNARWTERVGLIEPEPFTVTVAGREIEGWVFLPPGHDDGQRWPSVLSIHGGPEWMYGGYFLPEFHVLPSFGYAVLAANPTGSTGYGRAFLEDIQGDWIGRPARELMAVVDHAIAEGWSDPDLLAVMGGSYGGHLAAALTTQTDRFRAAACDRMYPQTVAFWGATDEKWFPEWEFGGRPFDPAAAPIYAANDPFTRIARVRTPTLLSHGLHDHRCPEDGTIAWHSALTSLGVPSRLLRFHDESHGIRNVDNQVFYLHQLLAWFETHVLEQVTP